MEPNTVNSLKSVLSNISITISFVEGLKILSLGLIQGFFLRYIFRKYATTFSSKIAFGDTILLITFSISALIAIIKSSLALSLGLVGALSVIRFRTAVKEPYNLSFLLLSICIGISVGASQFFFSLMISIMGSFAIIFIYKSVFRSNNSSKKIEDSDTISVELSKDTSMNDFYNLLSIYTEYYTIKSYYQESEKDIQIVVNARIKDNFALERLKNNIFSKFPESKFSFYNSTIQ